MEECYVITRSVTVCVRCNHTNQPVPSRNRGKRTVTAVSSRRNASSLTSGQALPPEELTLVGTHHEQGHGITNKSECMIRVSHVVFGLCCYDTGRK